MKRLLQILSFIVLLPALSSAQAGTFTFECICDYVTAVDSNCDICSSTIQSRLFCGVLVRKNNVAYKWIDAPYIVKAQGQNLILQEIIPNPEMITINLAGTEFGTMDSLKAAVDCPCGLNNDPLFYATDSVDIAPIYWGDTLSIVGRNLAEVTFDSVAKKWIINVDSIPPGSGSGTVISVAATAPAAGFTISGSPITVSGTFVFTLANDLAALEGLIGTGIGVRTGTDAWTLRTITAGAGITVNNGDGVAGNPEIINSAPDQVVVLTEGAGIDITGSYPSFTIASTVSGTVTSVAATAPAAGFTISGSPITTSGTFVFALANDLAALEAISFSGFAARTGTDTWAVRTFTAGTGISITNGAGIAGDPVISATNNGTVTSIGYVAPAAGLTITGANPVTSTGTWTFALANDLAGVEGLATNGIATRTAANTWATRTITAGANIAVTNGDGVAGNPTIAATGLPTGTGTAGRFALWTATTVIGDDAAFTFDGTNDRMTVTGTVAGTGANNAFLNLNGGSITGTVEAIRASVNASTSLDVVIANARNISNTGAVKLELEVGGTSASDPYVLWSVPSGSDFAMGIDNSASNDPLRITPNGTAPGSTANVGVTVTTTTTKAVGVNDDTPSHEIDIDGRNRATQFITRQIAPNTYGSGNFVFGNGAGTGPVYVSGSGSGNWFNIQFTTGTSPVANGTIFTCTYPTAFPFAITWPVFSAHNANAATDITKFRTGNHTDTNFTFVANGTLAASTSYAFIFHIGGSSSSTN